MITGMTKHIDSYIELCKELGPSTFATEHGVAVLLGLGVVGSLAENGERGGAQTFLASLDMNSQETKAIYRRVWRIEKAPFGPESKNVRVGRSSDNDIIIPEYSISQRHCEFQRTSENAHLVMDLGAHNPTIVQGTQLKAFVPHPIETEDEIVLGRYLFEFLTARTFCQRVAVMAGFQPM